jgi:hypothetical protein
VDHDKTVVPNAGAGVPLATLLGALDPAVFAPVRVPDPNAVARTVVIADARESPTNLPGGVALLVGRSIADPDFDESLRAAAGSGCVAVVVKRRGGDPATVETLTAAHDSTIAVLQAARDAPWVAIAQAVGAALSAAPTRAEPIGHHAATDVYDLADAIADRADAAITIEDVTGHVLAYSNGIDRPIDSDRVSTILGRNVPDLPENEAEYLVLARATGPVVFPAHDATLSRVVMPVRADDRLIGYIWAIDATGTDSTRIGREIAAMAQQVALHLLADIRRGDLERQRQSEILAAALAPDGGARSGDGAAAARRLPLALIGFGPIDPPDSVVDDYRLSTLISLSARSVCPDALCARLNDTVLALLPGMHQSPGPRMERLAKSTTQMISGTLGIAIGCAFACPIRTHEDIPAARADVELMLRYGARHGDLVPRDVVRDRHLVVLQALSESGTASDSRLIPQVAALIEHDRRHGTEFARTLRAHLDSFGDVRAAAATLSVHENSHRYRMRKIAERFDIDITDPRRRLVTWLQLHDAVAERR